MVPTMVEMIQRLCDRWERLCKETNGELVVDLHEEMQHLTLDIIGK
jgi:hypothetical protein